MPEKTFDKADLLKFFDESGHEAEVGRLTVVIPVKGLFDETTTERYPIQAETEAVWCERYGFAVLIQRVRCEGLHYLPKIHPLRTERPFQFRYGEGASSAALVRWAAEQAAIWRSWVKASASMLGTIDLTRRYDDDLPTQPEQTSEPEQPELTDDNMPTGTSIDNPFDDEGNDQDGVID